MLDCYYIVIFEKHFYSFSHILHLLQYNYNIKVEANFAIYLLKNISI